MSSNKGLGYQIVLENRYFWFQFMYEVFSCIDLEYYLIDLHL